MLMTFRPYGPDTAAGAGCAWSAACGALAHHIGDSWTGPDLTVFYAPYEGKKEPEKENTELFETAKDPAKTRQAAKRAFDLVACPVHSLATFPRISSCVQGRDRGCNPNAGVNWRTSPL